MRKNYTGANSMSNTTNTEMVAEIKPCLTYKEDNVDGSSLRLKRVNYTVNEKTAIKEKRNKDGDRE